MSEYQYYEFLAVDRPLDERQQAEVRTLSTRARITAASLTNEYHWGDFRGDPCRMMQRHYDAHLYVTNRGTHRVMLRLPRTLLSLQVAQRYCIDPHVTASVSGKHLILDLTSEDEGGDWVEGAEDAFDDDEEDEFEPPVPAGLGALTAPQRALADFLRLDTDLLTVAARTSPPLAEAKDDPGEPARWIEGLSPSDRNTFLLRVAQGQGAQVRMQPLRRFRGEPGTRGDDRPRRTVAELLDTAAKARRERERRAEAERAAQETPCEQERAPARTKRLDALAQDQEAAWARVEALIDTRKPDGYDAAVELLQDSRAIADLASAPAAR